MEKRVLAAIVLSVVVLFVFRYFEERRLAELAKRQPRVTKQATTIPEPAPAPLPKEPPPPPQLPEAPAPVPSDTKAASQVLVIDGPMYRAVLDNRGAVLTSWRLKDYKSGRGEVFEMIAAAHDAENRPFPGALVLDDPALAAAVNGEHYSTEVSGDDGSAGTLAPPVTVVMRLRRGDLAVEKRFHFVRENYLVDFSASFDWAGRPLPGRMLLGQDIGPEHEHLLNPSFSLTSISNLGGKVKREGPPKDEKEIRRIEGEVRWVGLDMHYFTLIAIPRRPLTAFEIQKRPVKTAGLDGKEVNRDLVRLTIPSTGSGLYQIYLGPKKQSNLEAVQGAGLSAAIDYGMFSFLVVPLLYSLRWIQQYVHNYGLAIIILTLLLTLLLFPFRLKQVFSMKKMQVVQPKIKEIQEKYRRYKKTDPRRAEMNQEIMAVYKAHNVNPLGGCLPLLLQMPLLFAFYQLLAASIELRQAPFVGWIHDLSLKDPYYVLPIVMGITMFVSQKMTPMAPGADPTQAKMMMIMPGVFTIMFLNVSSGLNLYFLCSNIFQIGFQKIVERWVGDGSPRAKS